MKNAIYIVYAIFLTGCSAIFVMETDDPWEKLAQAYELNSIGRPIPAERIAQESLNIFQKTQNGYGQGEALFFLGTFYKKKSDGTDADRSKHYLDLAMQNLTEAKALMLQSGEKVQAAKATFELAQTYRGYKDKEKYCSLFEESLLLYQTQEGKVKKFAYNQQFESPVHLIQAHIDGLCGAEIPKN